MQCCKADEGSEAANEAEAQREIRLNLEEVLEAQMVRRSKEGRTARRVAGVGRRAGRGRKPHQRSRLRPLVMSAAATIAAGFLCRLRAADHRGAPWLQRPLYRALHVAPRLRCTALHGVHECYTRDARHPT